jgi:two-component system C4-dicarboxylate transport sensor histidine kinase DctB
MNDGDPRSLEARRLAELGLLTAGLIHELRQPLFGVKALVQLSQMQPDRFLANASQILEQVAHMESLLRGYGDLSRRPGTAIEVFDAEAAVRSACVILEHRTRQAGVRLEVRAPAGHLVRGSMLALQQTVVNLGENAMEAVRGQPGGVVAIDVESRGDIVVVTIADNGPGFPPEMRENLFEPFRTTKPSGTGLGLSISRDLVASCGGELVLGGGRGATWEVRLRRG